VHPDRHGGADGLRTAESRLEEAVGLAEAIDVEVVHEDIVRLQKPRPATLFGTGAVERLAEVVEALGAGLVIVDGPLSPVQQRNLERAWKAKVIDRTALILEIFGERAQTKEGRLQVELAHLTYQRSRLVRSWTHLERQRGGVGFMGGPGETRVEIDRRLIGALIAKLRRDLEEVKKRRELHRASRRKVPFPVVALVGYTNAGKSTLFNRLTGAEVGAEDMLFATLDPTMRGMELPSGVKVILSDTVGFISDLPTHLVAAFRATLEEVQEAEIVVHVRDISHPDTEAQREDVEGVLRDLGLEDAVEAGLIEVLNKVDRLDADARATVAAQTARANHPMVPVSALTGEGCDRVPIALDRKLDAYRSTRRYRLPVEEGAAISWLYDHGEVLERHDEPDYVELRVRLDAADADRFERRHGPH